MSPSAPRTASRMVDGVPDLVGECSTVAGTMLENPAMQVAPALLGMLLVERNGATTTVVARIVESEAYDEHDPASHSWAGRTARTAPMFEGPGTAYVYRSYGMHWCLNVTVGPVGAGAAVLLRAAVVLRGHEHVRRRRTSARSDSDLLRGPGNLAAGLGVTNQHGSTDLTHPAAVLGLVTDGWAPRSSCIRQGPRVGVTAAAETPWRWWIDGVRAVSAYRRSPRAPRRGTGRTAS